MSRVGLDPTGTTLPATSYTVPGSNVVYLATTGSDSNNGLTVGAPKATLFGASGAYAAVPAGGTIVVAAGVYEEGEVGGSSLPDRTKACTIQAASGAQVWFDGSIEVTGFTGSGPWTKSGWTYNPGNTSGFTGTGGYAVDNPERDGRPTYYYDQCYIDGVRQQRVTTTSPAAGQFSVVSGTIYLGTNPSGKTVRMSRYRGLAVCSAQINWKGIGFRRYSGGATSSNTNLSFTAGYCTLYYGGSSAGSTIENCAFVDSGMVPVVVSKAGFTIHRNVFLRSGKTHLEMGGTTGGDGLAVTSNIFDRSNLGGFPSEPTAGAVKIVRTDNFVLADNLVTNFPYGHGLWWDMTCTRGVIAYNEINGGPNAKTGILWEISGGGLLPTTGTRTQYKSYIVGNRVLGTYTYVGINLLCADHTKVWGNYVQSAAHACFMIRQDVRPTGLLETAPSSYNYGAVDFLTDAIEFCNNDVGRSTLYGDVIVFNESNGTQAPLADTMISRFSGNWFLPRSSGPNSVQWGIGTNSQRVTYNAVPATAGASALDSRAIFVANGWRNFQQATAPAAVDRAPVPNDVQAIMDAWGPDTPDPEPPPPATAGGYVMTRRVGGQNVPYVLNRYMGGQWREQSIRVHTTAD